MNRIIKFIIPLAIISGCKSSVESIQPSSNKEVAVGLLTTWQDGDVTCKLWRIHDGDRIYVARCGTDVRVERHYTTTTSNGKTTTVHHHKAEALTTGN